MLTPKLKEELRKEVYMFLEKRMPTQSGYEASISLTDALELWIDDKFSQISRETNNPIDREKMIEMVYEIANKYIIVSEDAKGYDVSEMTKKGAAQIVDALALSIPSEKTEWIKVSDKLPENSNNVLVMIDNCRQISAYGLDAREWHCEHGEYKVTHWMPLPKSPIN